MVKSVFSFVEALSFSLKAAALDSRVSVSLTSAERALAADEYYELDSSGNVEVRRAKLRTLSNIRFAFRLFANVERADFALDVSGQGWQQLQRSLIVRDRLMHPKKLDDLTVTDDEIRDSLKSLIWFENELARLLKAALSSQERQIAALRAKVPNI